MKAIHLTLLLLLTVSGRSQDKGLYKFDPRTLKENEVTLSEIADEVYYIPLDNSFPLEVISSNITFTDDAIYFPSKDIGILAFNREGKFINKIGSIGRGPGEYIIYLLFCIDNKTGTVFVRDSNSNIKVFSRTGKYIRNFSLKEYGDVENIEFFNSKLLVQYSPQLKNSNYDWIYCDTLGNVIKKQNRHLPIFTANWGGVTSSFYKFKNQLSYYNAFTDTVFSILPDLTEKPSLIISPGEHRKPRSNLSIEQLMSEKYLSLSRIFETNRFFFIRYNYNKKHYQALIDKQNHKPFLNSIEIDESKAHAISGIVNDIDGGLWYLPESYFAEKGREYIVGIQSPYQIKKRVASNEYKNSFTKYPEKKKEFEKLANSLKETDNPVLMIVRLKK